MARRDTSPTLTHGVHQTLRIAILTGKLKPGQRLSPTAIGKELGTSTGVVREALTKLTAERLASGEQNRGFRVFEISINDLRNLSELRQLLEAEALRKSIASGDVRWESEILAAHYRLTNAPPAGAELDESGMDAFMIAHRQFHMSLIAACDNPLLFDTCGSMWDAGELYRRWSVAREHDQWIKEHAKLVEACLARDTDRGVAELKQHIAGTVRAVVDLIETDN